MEKKRENEIACSLIISLVAVIRGGSRNKTLGGKLGKVSRPRPFREKGAKLACADKLEAFLSLTLCNKANYNPNESNMMALKKYETGKKKCIVLFFLIFINNLMMLVCLIF